MWFWPSASMHPPRCVMLATMNSDSLLIRALGTRQLAASIFNYTVGSGIFALPALAVAQLGTGAPLAYLACAAIMLLVVLCFAEAGSRVSLTGGPYAYVEIALGPFVGLLAGILLLVTGVAAGAAVATLFVGSLLKLFPDAPAAVSPVLILLIIAIMVVINVRGVRSGARMIEAITLAKLVPLVGFVVIGAFFVDTSNLHMAHIPDASAVLGTAGIVIFAFSGIESALAPSGEVRAPARTVPRAAFIAIGAATVLYLAIQWVALGVKGAALGNESIAPLAEAAAQFAGPTGRTVLIVGAVISMFGYLSANILSVPRSVFALSRDRFIPRIFAAIHPAHRTPHVAIIIYGCMVVALALTGSFERLAILSPMRHRGLGVTQA